MITSVLVHIAHPRVSESGIQLTYVSSLYLADLVRPITYNFLRKQKGGFYFRMGAPSASSVVDV